MNREYNDNREYKNALDELHFSEEAKNRMVERLMERAEQPAPRRVRRSVSYTHLTLPTT